MCWSANASGAMTLLGLAMTLFHIIKGNRYHASLFYTIMEGFQYLQYFYLDSCSQMNWALTHVAHFLVWYQPIMWNIIGICHSNGNKKVFWVALVMSIITLLVSTGRLIWGDLHPEMPITLGEAGVATETCSVMGVMHVKWQWRMPSMSGMEPTFYVWLLTVCTPCFFWRPFKSGVFVILGTIFGFGISSYLVGLTGEAYSFWCAISVPLSLFSLFAHLQPTKSDAAAGKGGKKATPKGKGKGNKQN